MRIFFFNLKKKKQGILHLRWALKDRLNLDKDEKEKIPDKGITVSQSTEDGKPRLVTEVLRDLGREKAGKVDWGLFQGISERTDRFY